MVQESTRSRHQNLETALEGTVVLVDVGPTDTANGSNVVKLGETLGFRRNLKRQFTGGRQDQTINIMTTVVIAQSQLLHGRNEKGESFSGSRLGAGETIGSLQNDRQCFGLHDRHEFKAKDILHGTFGRFRNWKVRKSLIRNVSLLFSRWFYNGWSANVAAAVGGGNDDVVVVDVVVDNIFHRRVLTIFRSLFMLETALITTTTSSCLGKGKTNVRFGTIVVVATSGAFGWMTVAAAVATSSSSSTTTTVTAVVVLTTTISSSVRLLFTHG
mmetsp:Transcript_834/g.1373  ORF Transcript_834/g.1373 Transcript_834/m.1373 type:complete len:271 (+) Transcript_834:1047-1859(+)